MFIFQNKDSRLFFNFCYLLFCLISGLNNRNFFSLFWKLEVQDQGVDKIGSPTGLAAGCLDVFSHGLFTVCAHLWCLTKILF